MRYADYAYSHIVENQNDTARAPVLDQRAQNAGFDNTSDYIDHVQGAEDTRSFEGADGRTFWMNDGQNISGWNNSHNPERSTVIPTSLSETALDNLKSLEAGKLGVDKETIEERGPISDQDRAVPAPDKEVEESRDQAAQQPSPEERSAPAEQGEGRADWKEKWAAHTEQTRIPDPPPPPPENSPAETQGRSR